MKHRAEAHRSPARTLARSILTGAAALATTALLPACGAGAHGEHTMTHAQSHPQGHAHGHTEGHAHHAFSDAESLARVLDDPARDAWQRPEAVLQAMALTPTLRVADVGAGTGYFAVRLARAVPEGEVTATDLEPDLVRFMGARAHREHLANLRAVLATPSDTGLGAAPYDRILVVHVWHHLADRAALARDLAAALRPDGRLFVLDFAVDAQKGPPPSLRLAPEAIIADLEAAGLKAQVLPVALPDQYLIEARRAP